MKSIFKDPFVHFIGLGLLLFVGHSIWESSIAKSDNTIVIDDRLRTRLIAVFKAEQSRAPDDTELGTVIDGYVTEQALSREAMRAGLDDGDTIITRRLAQKMRFMLESNSFPADPGDAVLKAWQRDNPNDFIRPDARTISHVYISGSTDAGNLMTRVKSLAGALKPQPKNWAALGDPFMLQNQYGLLDDAAMGRVFGPAFTKSVMELPESPGIWQGPVESAFGLHYVRIDRVRDREVLSFETARPDILKDWQNVTLDAENAYNIKAVIERYKVDVK